MFWLKDLLTAQIFKFDKEWTKYTGSKFFRDLLTQKKKRGTNYTKGVNIGEQIHQSSLKYSCLAKTTWHSLTF